MIYRTILVDPLIFFVYGNLTYCFYEQFLLIIQLFTSNWHEVVTYCVVAQVDCWALWVWSLGLTNNIWTRVQLDSSTSCYTLLFEYTITTINRYIILYINEKIDNHHIKYLLFIIQIFFYFIQKQHKTTSKIHPNTTIISS